MNASYFFIILIFIMVYRGKQTSALVLARFMKFEAICPDMSIVMTFYICPVKFILKVPPLPVAAILPAPF